MSDDSRWRPSAEPGVLEQRAGIIRSIRDFFDSRGFVEVHTPCLSRDVVVDRYIEPLPVSFKVAGSERQFWLQTSPEFAMKRLLAAGARSIYQLGPVFRGEESGRHHNIEFTMLEWYRVGDDYRQGMELLDEFGRSILETPPAVRMTYRDAFRKFAELDPWQEGDSQVLNQLMHERVEPGLAKLESAIIYDWPADQAALAKTRDDGEMLVAERFEWFCHGVELANGYHELLDVGELKRRNRRVNELREADGRSRLPEESRLLSAMQSGLPPCCGVALGVDRLVMLALGKDSIDQVLAFDIERA